VATTPPPPHARKPEAMTSALTTRGSTRQWRTLRAALGAALHAAHRAGRRVECPYCDQPILPGQHFDVDHTIPRIHGGTDYHVRPAHAACNRRAGATTRARSTATPSRPW
jgi:hypothetical protein